MNRYVIYRCPENCDCHKRLKEHELIGAAYAASFEEALAEIKQQIQIDISSLMPEVYSIGEMEIIELCEEERSRKYDWSMIVTFFPDDAMAPNNISIDYAIQEIEEKETI